MSFEADRCGYDRLEMRPILLEAKNPFPVPLGILHYAECVAAAKSERGGDLGERYAYTTAMPVSSDQLTPPAAQGAETAAPAAPSV
jgi:hypothetical protein